MKIKTGDSVKVIKGKDSGKVAKVEKVFSKEAKVLVEGVNQ
ncbi:MAG TPA: KOW motif-containing protein, partial [Patescibacteria group bacterium]|nr:KOW motif-containing protein [Patescibacteria group bacterium]